MFLKELKSVTINVNNQHMNGLISMRFKVTYQIRYLIQPSKLNVFSIFDKILLRLIPV